LEEEELTGELMKFKNNAQRASQLTNDLKGLDNKIKENVNKI